MGEIRRKTKADQTPLERALWKELEVAGDGFDRARARYLSLHINAGNNADPWVSQALFDVSDEFQRASTRYQGAITALQEYIATLKPRGK